MRSPETERKGTVEIVGPFEVHKVIVNGWSVPLLTAHPKQDGSVEFVLDRRIALEAMPEEWVLRIASFIADAIAMGQGFACHPFEDELPPRRDPTWPRRTCQLGTIDGPGPMGVVQDEEE